MKYVIIILLLSGCAAQPAYESLPFDTAAYAKQNKWCGKEVTTIYYDKNCKAKVRIKRGNR